MYVAINVWQEVWGEAWKKNVNPFMPKL